MSSPTLRRWLRQLDRIIRGLPRKKLVRFKAPRRICLEELESRLAPSAGVSSHEQLLQSYGQLPISFEVNDGQTAAQVQYLARGSGYALFLTSTGAVLSLEQATPPASDGLGAHPLTTAPSSASATGVALAMNLVGANPDASVAGLDRQAGTSNYFIGNDPGQWRTNLANYGQVEYQGVYPGVNLVYYGSQQQLEYDFVVAPGADPGSIRFDIQGANSVSLDDQGNLILSTTLGDVLEHAPVVYQEVGATRQAVAGQFVLLGQDEVGFLLGAYDSSLPLTIDPVLSYSTYLGGGNSDLAYGIAVNAFGNAYVTGYTLSTNFPTTSGAYQTAYKDGGYDAFVAKLNITPAPMMLI